MRAAVELTVFAPLGVAAAFAEGGPAAARRELARAGATGRSTIARGLAEARGSVPSGGGGGDDGDDVDDRAPGRPRSAVERRDEVDPDPDGRSATAGSQPEGAARADDVPEPALAHVPDVEALALPDYDHLPASDVVAKLATLSPADRALVGAYESANRRRRTVLGRLAQLGDA